MPAIPPVDATLTIAPPRSAIARISCFIESHVPLRFASTVRVQSSSSSSVMGPTTPSVPALLNATSRRPYELRTESTSVRTSASRATSVATNVACSPWRRMSATTAVPSVSRRPATTTRAPSAAKASAVALPMPDVPPVTSAARFWNLFIGISPSRTDQSFTDSCQTRSGRYRVRARSAAGGVTSDASRAGGNQCPHGILLQQVERYGQENHVLHQERNVASHRRKSAGGRSPPVRHEWNDREGHDERQARARRPQSSQGFVPEADEDERTEQPLRNSEEPTRAPDAEYRVHPGDERAVADEGNKRLRLVVQPLLIPEQEEDYHHRCPKQMVIEVPLQQARLAQERRQQRGDGSHPDLLCRSLDRSSRRRPFRPSTGVIVTALIRGATGGPAGLASEIGAAGPSVEKARRPVGARAEASAPGVAAACTDEWPPHRTIAFNAASPASGRRPGPHRPAGAFADTLAHVAPEQTGRMNRSVDHRSDLYALGVTLYDRWGKARRPVGARAERSARRRGGPHRGMASKSGHRLQRCVASVGPWSGPHRPAGHSHW